MEKINILVIGSGGREDALCWKIGQPGQSDLKGKLYCAPGNAGTSLYAENVDIKPTDFPALIAFAKTHNIGLTVVGPEQPLINGIVDAFQAEKLTIFGPSQKAARLEGSKAFAKELMQECGVPTAPFEIFYDYQQALAHVKARTAPMVIKADGLAAGKGALVCRTRAQAEQALQDIMVAKKFGSAGDLVVVEDCLQGQEISVMAFCHGTDCVLMLPSQDHKALGKDDTGPNTGGMGAYAPVPWVTPKIMDDIKRTVFEPILQGMASAGCPYLGVLYAGLMLNADGIWVLEFNVRFGDPETQPILDLLQSDLVEVMLACLEGRIQDINLAWSDWYSVCVVLASRGYPGDYQTGLPITGIKAAEFSLSDLLIFHAGTKLDSEGALVTNGGRVLGLTIAAETLEQAIAKAYHAAQFIRFTGKILRTDIGQKGLTTPSFLTTS